MQTLDSVLFLAFPRRGGKLSINTTHRVGLQNIPDTSKSTGPNHFLLNSNQFPIHFISLCVGLSELIRMAPQAPLGIKGTGMGGRHG